MKTLTGLSKPALALDGQPLVDQDGKPSLIGGIIANCIARGQSKEPVRAMEVALKIHRSNNKLELDDADVQLARAAVQDDQVMNNQAKAAALTVLDEAEGSEVKPNRAQRRRRDASSSRDD